MEAGALPVGLCQKYLTPWVAAFILVDVKKN
jgi:hypothetical protein